MNVDNFKTFLSRNSVATDNWKIYYDFSKVTGGFGVLNELKSYSSQISGSCVYTENNPGLIVGVNTGNFLNQGSGFFSGNSTVRLTDYINVDNWTMFLTCRHSGLTIPNKASILFTNQTNLNDSSGFCMGINSINRFFIEYNTISGKYTYTSDTSAKNSTCFSLSKKLNNFELSVHDVANYESSLETFKLDNYINSNIYYLGSTYNINEPLYTGFVGYMDDFIFLSGYIGYAQRNDLSKAIFCTGIVPSYVLKIVSGYNKISLSTISTGIIIGTGITGYESISIGNIPNKNGSVISICANSGIEGPIYGEQIIFKTGSETGSRIINVTIPEEVQYDKVKMMSFSDNIIKYLGEVDDNDFFNVNVYFGDPFHYNYVKVNSYDQYLQMQVLDLKFTGQDIELFENGVYQISGLNINGNISSGNYSISGNRYVYSKNLYKENERILFFDRGYSRPYYVTGITNETSWKIDMPFFPKVSDLSLYLNGQKLIYGYDFNLTIGSNYFQIVPIKFGGSTNITGQLVASIKSKNLAVSLTGTAVENNIFTTNLINLRPMVSYNNFSPFSSVGLSQEEVFLNGILQEKNENYLKTTDQNPIKAKYWPKQNKNLIYNNENYGYSGFNIYGYS